jgi:hypothetical protein
LDKHLALGVDSFYEQAQQLIGVEVESAQFNFTQQQLDYIAGNYIRLDHEGRVSASGGVSYLWLGTRFSIDDLFGTGLREDLTDSDGYVIPNGGAYPEL